eukprot:9705397-Lingulodinium_polyedra.AAC.1
MTCNDRQRITTTNDDKRRPTRINAGQQPAPTHSQQATNNGRQPTTTSNNEGRPTTTNDKR